MIEMFAALFAFICFSIELFMVWTVYWVYQQAGGWTLPTIVWAVIILGMIGVFHSESLDA